MSTPRGDARPKARATPARLRASAPLFAGLFMALGDETRLSLVARLSGAGPLSITVLTEGTEVSRQAVSKHLQVLEGAGLVRVTRIGRERVWELETRRLAEAKRYLDAVSEQWDDALERLRSFVEDEDET